MRSKFEKIAHKELEAEGYLVDYKIRASGFKNPSNYNCDYLGNFDLLCWKDGKLRFISIKGHGGIPSEHRRSIEAMKMPEGVQKEIWCYRHLKSGDKRKNYCKKEIIE